MRLVQQGDKPIPTDAKASDRVRAEQNINRDGGSMDYSEALELTENNHVAAAILMLAVTIKDKNVWRAFLTLMLELIWNQ